MGKDALFAVVGGKEARLELALEGEAFLETCLGLPAELGAISSGADYA